MNESITSFFIFMIWWQMTILQSWATCDEGNFFFVANSSRQLQKYEGGSIRRLWVSTAASVPRGLPGQMENKPLYLHGMLHWPSPSTRLRLCPTKQLVNERLWSGANETIGSRLVRRLKKRKCGESARAANPRVAKLPTRCCYFQGFSTPPHPTTKYVSQFINQMPRQMYVNISSLPLSSV